METKDKPKKKDTGKKATKKKDVKKSKKISLAELHQQKDPLLIANVWDAHSAQLAQAAGFKALGTSSHAIAFSLGYKDGEQIPVKELFFVIERIVAVSKIPVSVDFEAGYSEDPSIVAKYALKLQKIGVKGINLEDGTVVDGKRKLQKEKVLIKKIKAIKAATNLFINARTDTYTTIHENAFEESIRRAKLYQKAGADGIFVPLLEEPLEIAAFVDEIKLPLNVFTTPNLPSYQALKELGVKRISHGAKQYDLLMKKSDKLFNQFIETKDYSVILGK